MYRQPLTLLLLGIGLTATLLSAADNPNGCTNVAQYSNGTWSMKDCGGTSACGSSNDQPCTESTFGPQGGKWTACACGDSGSTPLCCHSAIDESTGVPFGQGFCAGMIPPAAECDAGDNCDSEGSETEEQGVCSEF